MEEKEAMRIALEQQQKLEEEKREQEQRRFEEERLLVTIFHRNFMGVTHNY